MGGRASPGLLALPVIGLLVLFLVGITSIRSGIEEDLRQRATAALVADGVPVASVDVAVTGRDVVVEGVLGAVEDVDRARVAVAAVDGVRAVDVGGVAVDDAGGGAATAPDTDAGEQAAPTDGGSLADDTAAAPGTDAADDDPDAAADVPSEPAPVDGEGDGTAEDPWVSYFESNSIDVTDTTRSVAEAREVLVDVAAGSVVRLVGYADPVGDPQTNRQLSRRRANRVANQLRQVRPDLTYDIAARGEDDPEASDDESRRVEFWVEQG